MQKIKQWEIIPLNDPTITKNCSKCGNNSTFVNTGNFRINANQSKLDVWLIYQCRKCKTTWNMTILSRVNKDSIPTELYQKFLNNDKDLAMKYAFDVTTHYINKTILNYESLAYEIKGEPFSIEAALEPVQLYIKCNYSVELRIDKILSEKLGVSRNLIKKLGKSGKIGSPTESKVWKEKINKDTLITFTP
jgi:hypothetical protein